jgi:hypothetical protein
MDKNPIKKDKRLIPENTIRCISDLQGHACPEMA